jgi:hypothetical protein
VKGLSIREHERDREVRNPVGETTNSREKDGPLGCTESR